MKADAYGLAAARRVGRGDEERGLALLAIGFGAGSFVSLFLPWLGFDGHDDLGWSVPVGSIYGLLALGVVLVALLFLARAWTSRGSELVAFCFVAATGLIGVSAFVNLRWGNFLPSGFSHFQDGAWFGLVFAVLLILLAAVRLAGLWQSAP